MEKVRTTSLEELYDLLGVTAESVAEARKEHEAYILGWQLAQIRKREGVSQVTLAEAMGAQQTRISKIERGAAPTLQTIQSYIEGLGGQLRIEANFGDHSYMLDTAPIVNREPTPAS